MFKPQDLERQEVLHMAYYSLPFHVGFRLPYIIRDILKENACVASVTQRYCCEDGATWEDEDVAGYEDLAEYIAKRVSSLWFSPWLRWGTPLLLSFSVWVASSSTLEATLRTLCGTAWDSRNRPIMWEATKTAGTDMEQSNPVKIFRSHWLEIQKFYIRGARLIYVTTSTASSRSCRVFRAQHLILDENAQTSEPLFDNAVQRILTAEKTLEKISLFGDHKQLNASNSESMEDISEIVEIPSRFATG